MAFIFAYTHHLLVYSGFVGVILRWCIAPRSEVPMFLTLIVDRNLRLAWCGILKTYMYILYSDSPFSKPVCPAAGW